MISRAKKAAYDKVYHAARREARVAAMRAYAAANAGAIRAYHASPEYKFSQQRHRARHRGIEWCLTFAEWLAWWGGDLVRRGRKANDLVMARPGDSGPYRIDNIVKLTNAQNSREANLHV